MAEDDGNSISINEYVIQEAKEKSYEIEVKALKQYEKEKAAIVQRESERIKNDYEKGLRDKEMEYRIRRSTSINNSRVKKMEARNQAMMKVFSEAQFLVFKKIREDRAFYKDLLVKLIWQGLIKMFEHKIIVRCLQRDVDVVEEAIPLAAKQFKDQIKHELDLDFSVDIKIERDFFLDERLLDDNLRVRVENYSHEVGENEVIGKSDDIKKCFGGVLLVNSEQNIVCKNTLDVRVDLCYQDSLPDLREILFPEKKKV